MSGPVSSILTPRNIPVVRMPATTACLGYGDCFDLLPLVPPRSVHLVIADLPYGVTACEWDRRIDLDQFWTEMHRIVTPKGAVVMFGTQPFTTDLVASNREWFRYNVVWRKSRPTGFQRSQQRIMSEHEDILIFSPGNAASGKQNAARRMTYNPQGLVLLPNPRQRKPSGSISYLGKHFYNKACEQTRTNFPRSVLEFESVHKPIHPSQKPVDLLRYLSRTFSNVGEVVLDPTMGVGSTGVAALAEGRRFIGIEMRADYFGDASLRMQQDQTVQATVPLRLRNAA